MCKIKCRVEEGLVSQEKIVSFQTADGNVEQVPVYIDLVDETPLQPSFRADIVGRNGEKVLIELPNESSSGRWRYIVNASELLEA